MSKWRCFLYPAAKGPDLDYVFGPVRSGKSILTRSLAGLLPSSLDVRGGWTIDLASPENESIPFAPDAPMLPWTDAEMRDDR